MAKYGTHVETILQIAQYGRIGIDDGDFVRLFAGEMVGGGGADLSGAENEDLHGWVRRAVRGGEFNRFRRFPAGLTAFPGWRMT